MYVGKIEEENDDGSEDTKKLLSLFDKYDEFAAKVVAAETKRITRKQKRRKKE